MTVALSRARLGLYILGRREVFESCYELRQAFDLLLQRPDKLTLSTGELWPSKRSLADEEAGDSEVPGEAIMEGVEHLGQFVFEMTTSKIKQMQEQDENRSGVADAAAAQAQVEVPEEAMEEPPAEEEGEEGEEEGSQGEEEAEEIEQAEGEAEVESEEE